VGDERPERSIVTTVQLSAMLGLSPSSIAHQYRLGQIAPVLTTVDGDVLWDSEAVRKALTRPVGERSRPDPERPDVRLLRPLLEADSRRPRPVKAGPPRGVYRGHRLPDPEAVAEAELARDDEA
jgi:hypothetical protein